VLASGWVPPRTRPAFGEAQTQDPPTRTLRSGRLPASSVGPYIARIALRARENFALALAAVPPSCSIPGMVDQAEKGRAFRKLHEGPGAFVIPNPWDVGSARVLEALGFQALATTSGGFAISIGRLDGQPGRDAVLAHAAALTGATSLPISADLENGFGDSPDEVAKTIRGAAAAGLVGGSIEDFTGKASEPLYEIAFAADRIRAAVQAARSFAFPFTLTARAENFFRGPPDLRDTIRRLQAYQEAGADVLYAPSLSAADIGTVVRAVDRPVNVLAGSGGQTLSVAELTALGVRRISVGGFLSSVAYGALIHAAEEMQAHGTFGFVQEAKRARRLKDLLAQSAPGRP
jgi:2-methylisocitrate lyase-like PEP mutase family enzyme